MNLKRCNNGHFYDADKFSTCPHCNMTASADEETVALDMGKFGQVDDEGPTVALQEDIPVFADSIPESTINEEKTVKKSIDVRHLLGKYVSKCSQANALINPVFCGSIKI